jgi:transposase
MTLPLSAHTVERTWRHLDSCQFKTYLHARIPHGACGEHGVIRILVPWAKLRCRLTLLSERLAIDECVNVMYETRILRISLGEASGLLERSCDPDPRSRWSNGDLSYDIGSMLYSFMANG